MRTFGEAQSKITRAYTQNGSIIPFWRVVIPNSNPITDTPHLTTRNAP